MGSPHHMLTFLNEWLDANEVLQSLSNIVPTAGPSHTMRSEGDHLPLLLWSYGLQPERPFNCTVGQGQAAQQNSAWGVQEAGLPVPLHGARRGWDCQHRRAAHVLL